MATQQQEPAQQVVVVGASAGGVEALSTLVSTVPANFPAPVVIAQHLDPQRPSHLVEILARRCRLPVQAVTRQETLTVGRVYVLPPNQEVEMRDGHLMLRRTPEDQ
jgi:two-component system, chemotaxis family, CheB/CheR fusion protein